MLATSALWFRYQDDPILKGLTLDFSTRPSPGWLGPMAAEIHAVYESERVITSRSKGAVMWQGKPLDYSKRGLLALRQQSGNRISGSRSANLLYRYRQRYCVQPATLGWMKLKSHAGWRMRSRWLMPAFFAISRPVQCLSHGQKRVAIAGTLVLQAQYLLLDEPTAGP